MHIKDNLIDILKAKYDELVAYGDLSGDELADYKKIMSIETDSFEYAYIFQPVDYSEYVLEEHDEDESMAILFKESLLDTFELYKNSPMVTIKDEEEYPIKLEDDMYALVKFECPTNTINKKIIKSLIDGVTLFYSNNKSIWKYYCVWSAELNTIYMCKKLNNKSEVIDNWAKMIL